MRACARGTALNAPRAAFPRRPPSRPACARRGPAQPRRAGVRSPRVHNALLCGRCGYPLGRRPSSRRAFDRSRLVAGNGIASRFRRLGIGGRYICKLRALVDDLPAHTSNCRPWLGCLVDFRANATVPLGTHKAQPGGCALLRRLLLVGCLRPKHSKRGKIMKTKRVLVATFAIFGLLSIWPQASFADDYDTCTYDARQELDACLRMATANHAADASCYSYYRQSMRTCQQVYNQ